MKGAQHICSICHQEFSRNSNAKRHNINIHASQAQIVPLRVFRHGDTSDWLKFKKSGFFHSSKGQSREERLSATLETIGREFESCEHELQMLSSQERAMLLAQLVVHSLTCEDPRDPMKKFQKDWRKQRLNMKIIQYVADGFDTTPLVAKQMLLNLLK